jgi:hypothetical protein
MIDQTRSSETICARCEASIFRLIQYIYYTFYAFFSFFSCQELHRIYKSCDETSNTIRTWFASHDFSLDWIFHVIKSRLSSHEPVFCWCHIEIWIYLSIYLTECEVSLINAISFIFSNAQHALCIWHVDKNVIKNCKSSSMMTNHEKLSTSIDIKLCAQK